MKNSLEKIVRGIQKTKKLTGLKTYQIEDIFVLVFLAIIGIISRKGMVEWIGVGAVFFNFGYVQIADRLEESENKRVKGGKKAEVECYKKLNKYLYAKEILWTIYFMLLGAWSALAGVAIFMAYPYWRKIWRKYNLQ